MTKDKLSVAIAAALGVTVGGMGSAFASNDLEVLKAELNRLQAQVQQLEQQQTDQVMVQQLQTQVEALEQREENLIPANVVTGGDKPGTFKLPGSDTSVRIGGYIKADVIYNVDEDLGDSLDISAVNVTDAAVDEGNVRMHARQSRIFIKTSTLTNMGELSTHWEGDFFGSGGNELVSNSRHFRMRHAYGQLGPFLAGQTWTNFSNWHMPEIVDFAGPAGSVFIRQAQLRYTFDVADNTSVAFSLENPESAVRTTGGAVSGGDEYPDITGRLDWNNGDSGTSATVAAVVRGIEVEGLAGDDSVTGYGVTTGLTQHLGNTSLQVTGTYGDGLGRYLYYGFLDGGAHEDVNGNLETTESWGATAALTQKFNPNLQASVMYGILDVDVPASLYPDSAEQLQSVHLNLLWRPVPRTVFGIEYQYAARENQNGADGEANRIQLGAQYNF